MATPANWIDFGVWACMFGETIAVTRGGESLTTPDVGVVYINNEPGPDGRVRFRGADVYVDAATPLAKGDQVRMRGLEWTCNYVVPQTDANWVRCILTCHAA